MLVALVDAALWAGVAVVSKRLLDYVDPLVLNFAARLITLITLCVVGLPLAAVGVLPLGFGMTWAAAGYILLTAVFGWFIGYTAYLFALRRGDVAVVAPMGATDPVFTGLFALALLGTPLSGLTVAGLLCTTVGVMAVTYWMEVRSPQTAAVAPEPPGPAAVPLVPQPAAALPDPAPGAGSGSPPHPAAAGVGAAAAQPRRLRRQVQVGALALTAAASWGLATILIQEGIAAAGSATLTLIVVYEALGCLLLAPLAWRARRRALVRPLGPLDRRRLAALLIAGGVLDSTFIVVFYVVVGELGAVLTNVAIATSPVFAIIGGMLLLRERLSLKLALAVTLTLFGVLLAVLGSG